MSEHARLTGITYFSDQLALASSTATQGDIIGTTTINSLLGTGWQVFMSGFRISFFSSLVTICSVQPLFYIVLAFVVYILFMVVRGLLRSR